MPARRWSDNDRYLGPFTYAKAEGKHAYRPWGIELESGCDEYPGNALRFSGFSRTLIIALPDIIKPWKEPFGEPITDPGLIARIGPRYYHTHRRQFGFSIVEGAAHIHYGAQTHDSRTDSSKCYFFPWRQWRHVRHSLYDLEGKLFADMPAQRRMMDTWAWREALQAACPTRTFEFLDYDGQAIAVHTRIEEREWLAGEGRFKWLSWFRKPNISRSLDLQFSSEVGNRKGSWKGGTTGHSISMTPGELHQSAFRRYCGEHALTFVEVPGKGAVPHGVYWCPESSNFYSLMTSSGMGVPFYDAWKDRKGEFPGKPVRPAHDETLVAQDAP